MTLYRISSFESVAWARKHRNRRTQQMYSTDHPNRLYAENSTEETYQATELSKNKITIFAFDVPTLRR